MLLRRGAERLKQDAGWPESVEKVSVFLFAGFTFLVILIAVQQNVFFVSLLSSLAHCCVGSLCSREGQK